MSVYMLDQSSYVRSKFLCLHVRSKFLCFPYCSSFPSIYTVVAPCVISGDVIMTSLLQ